MGKSRAFDRYGKVVAHDKKYTGEEPVWDDVNRLDVMTFMKRRSSMLNFYNYYLTAKDLKPSTLLWMKNNGYSSKDIKAVRSAPDTSPSPTIHKLCRAMNLGMLPTHTEASKYYESMDGLASDTQHNDEKLVKDELSKIITSSIPDATPVMIVSKEKQLSPQERMFNKINAEVISQLDYLLDDVFASSANRVKTDFSLFKALKEFQVPAAGLKFISEWINRHKSEMNKALDKSCDQMIEGYSYLKTPGLKCRIKILENLLGELEKYKAGIKKAKVPRKKKVPSLDKQVARIKYEKSNDEFAISSISPINMLGTNVLITFNTKYRMLAVYYTPGGLSVKGTTIQDFSENSFQLKLRKPEETLTKIVKARTAKAINKLLDTVKTKRGKVNGRINETTILLKTL